MSVVVVVAISSSSTGYELSLSARLISSGVWSFVCRSMEHHELDLCYLSQLSLKVYKS